MSTPRITPNDQSKNIIGLFAAKGESFLHIVCDKHSNGLSLTLE